MVDTTTPRATWRASRVRVALGTDLKANIYLRASYLVHEARHYERDHNRGDFDSSWGYNGAYRWQVAYLSWVYLEDIPAYQSCHIANDGNALMSVGFEAVPDLSFETAFCGR